VTDEKLYGKTADGVMTLAGHDVRELLREHGSPLVVMLEQVIRDNCRAYREAMARRYPRSRVYYASKAFLTTGFCRLIEQEGLGLDVVSEGELATALSAGFDPEMILMHGNAKTEDDLTLALRSGVGRIVIDNLDEIGRLARLTEELDVRARVLIRVTPGVKPNTHQYVQTGQVDSKFGFNLEGGGAEQAVVRVKQVPRFELAGLHCHIGSQIFALKPYAIAARTMMGFYARVQRELGVPISELNLGGGLGIRYAPDDCPPAVDEHINAMTAAVIAAAEEHGVEPPLLLDEPGRSIVGRAGVTLYTIQSTKRIPGVRNYASVDGGMTDNPRYALYEARHHMLVASRLDQPADTLWSISGRCCESGDMLIHDVTLPEITEGDVLAVLSTGAYTHSMASNYNRVGRPAVVLAAPGRVGLLAARETAQELLRLDRIPAWLERGAAEED
jgi:diaminopimelate decarboxylase